MQVSIIAIGDELLIGQVVDTNSGLISREINPDGWSVRSVRVVADDAEEIKRAIKQAFDETDVVLTTGGLGPTKDDITKPTLCEPVWRRTRLRQGGGGKCARGGAQARVEDKSADSRASLCAVVVPRDSKPCGHRTSDVV